MLFVWKENTSGCSVLRICKLLNCLVVQRGIMLCQNNNPHCFLLPPRPNCQSKPCQKSFKFPPLIYITPSLNPHFVFPFAHSYPSFSFFFFLLRLLGGWKRMCLLTTVTWRLVSTAGTLGWVQGHALSSSVTYSCQRAAAHLQRQCSDAEEAALLTQCRASGWREIPFTYVLLKPLPFRSSGLLWDVRVGWGVEEGLCKLNIWRCVHLSYLLCLECAKPGLDKHSALMSFIPLFIPYLLTCMALSVSFCFSFARHLCHYYPITYIRISLSLFPPRLSVVSLFCHSVSFPLYFHPAFPPDSLLCSPSLFFSTRVIWGIYQQTWSRAPLHSALLCVETLIRCIAWQRSPKPASFKSTDVPSDIHTHTHTNPLQVYRSFIDALLQSAQLQWNLLQNQVSLYLAHL